MPASKNRRPPPPPPHHCCCRRREPQLLAPLSLRRASRALRPCVARRNARRHSRTHTRICTHKNTPISTQTHMRTAQTWPEPCEGACQRGGHELRLQHEPGGLAVQRALALAVRQASSSPRLVCGRARACCSRYYFFFVGVVVAVPCPRRRRHSHHDRGRPRLSRRVSAALELLLWWERSDKTWLKNGGGAAEGVTAHGRVEPAFGVQRRPCRCEDEFAAAAARPRAPSGKKILRSHSPRSPADRRCLVRRVCYHFLVPIALLLLPAVAGRSAKQPRAPGRGRRRG